MLMSQVATISRLGPQLLSTRTRVNRIHDDHHLDSMNMEPCMKAGGGGAWASESPE
jgi:hypothetical protein